MLLPGGFGPAPAAASGGKYSAGIVAAVPYMGESDLTNTEDLAGKIVVMGRGKATFASKSLRAQSAGAIAVVIVQNCQVWPYTMTDGKGEAGAELTVPVLMMRQDHGQRLVKLLEEEQGVGEHATTRSEEDGSSGKRGGFRQRYQSGSRNLNVSYARSSLVSVAHLLPCPASTTFTRTVFCECSAQYCNIAFR